MVRKVLYNMLLWLAVPFVALHYGAKMIGAGKYRKGLGQRFGILPSEVLAGMSGSPRIWVHAVSVGEVTAAAPVIASLKDQFPDACIVLSTGTETGQEMARRIVTAAAAFILYPLDISFVVRKAIDRIRPDLFLLLETELWPNFIRYCRLTGVKIVMANGRLSPRSFRRYALTRFFWKGILDAIEEVGVISETDAERFRFLGVPADRVHVFGNAKYDSLAAQASPSLHEEIGARLNIVPGDRVLVAGSTHEGEEEVVFGVYRQLLATHADCMLIIVPRHIERTQAVLALASQNGFVDTVTMTEINRGRKRDGERIIVVDVIGELFRVYSLASVVFCGGSLVPKGGQNVIEAAAWGKVVLYGPFMDDFWEERELLEGAGAGMTVRDADELLKAIRNALDDPASRDRRGARGRRLVAANMGAAGKHASLVGKVLTGKR
ncbi:MAG: 3-deoxy-D-manno-octulosonic acid transferase [Deltaproteobacteria bacterium]|nr:3-deoxy-D-manno-octulosonic acid transferase [Deltaproteobacteria bacterium]